MSTGWPVREGGMKLLVLAMCWELCTDIRDLLWLLSHVTFNNFSVTGMLTGTACQTWHVIPRNVHVQIFAPPLCPNYSVLQGKAPFSNS